MKKNPGTGKKTSSSPSTVEELEVQLQNSPNNLPVLCQLVKLYYQQTVVPPSVQNHIQKAYDIYSKNHEVLTAEHGCLVAEVMMLQFKHAKYSVRGSMKLNTSVERLKILDDIVTILNAVIVKNDMAFSQKATLLLATVKEWKGEYIVALSLLSDLISQQAMEGVDLSYVILKASLLLKHIGQVKQALEYLEFLLDDPPVSQGFTKVHITAYLILTYETSGDKYKVFCGKAYKDLVEACKEACKGPGVSKQSKRMLDLSQSPNVTSSPELWELMSVHALDKCEYILAAELLSLAAQKAPTKGLLFMRWGEVLFLLGEKAEAEKVGERAYSILGGESADIRNLLIQINPDKWTDKLRYAKALTVDPDANSLTPAIEQAAASPVKAAGGGEGWLDKIKGAFHAVVAPVAEAARPSSRGSSPNKVKPAAEPNPTPATEPAASQPSAASGAPTSAAAVSLSPSVSSSSVSPPAKEVRSGSAQKGAGSRSSTSPQRTNRSAKANSATGDGDAGSSKSSRLTRPPALSPESRKYLQLALKGNSNIHFYSPSLKALSQISKKSNESS